MVGHGEGEGDGAFGADLAGGDGVGAIGEDEALRDVNHVRILDTPMFERAWTYDGDVDEAEHEDDDA